MLLHDSQRLHSTNILLFSAIACVATEGILRFKGITRRMTDRTTTHGKSASQLWQGAHKQGFCIGTDAAELGSGTEAPSGLHSARCCDMLRMCCSFDAPEGLRQGSDSVTQDFLTNIYRMKQLGFNAVRLPYRQSDFHEPWNPRIIQHECQVAPAVRSFWETQWAP